MGQIHFCCFHGQRLTIEIIMNKWIFWKKERGGRHSCLHFFNLLFEDSFTTNIFQKVKFIRTVEAKITEKIRIKKWLRSDHGNERISWGTRAGMIDKMAINLQPPVSKCFIWYHFHNVAQKLLICSHPVNNSSDRMKVKNISLAWYRCLCMSDVGFSLPFNDCNSKSNIIHCHW